MGMFSANSCWGAGLAAGDPLKSVTPEIEIGDKVGLAAVIAISTVHMHLLRDYWRTRLERHCRLMSWDEEPALGRQLSTMAFARRWWSSTAATSWRP